MSRLSSQRGIVTVALGAVAGVATYALVSSGVLAGAAPGLVRVPPAAAAGLPSFADCEGLRQWYVRATLPEVGPWGLQDPRVYAAREGGSAPAPSATSPSAAAGGAAERPAASSGTGTNVQEAAVDESDVAKTDGRLVVRVVGRRLVVTDVTGPTPRQLSSTPLPGATMLRPELLLHEGRVTVVGEELRRGWDGPGPLEPRMDVDGIRPGPGLPDSRVQVLTFDVQDAAAPRLTSSRSIDGGIVASRGYADGTVRVVTASAAPAIDFVEPNRDRTPAQAQRANKSIVGEAPLSAWLPTLRSGADKQRVDCSDVRHPRRLSGFGTVTVLGFSAKQPDAVATTAVVASGDLVYSSAERLYVGSTVHGSRLGHDQTSTSVHAFALAGRSTTYVASGELPGSVEDRWSFDEHDGRLRVAVALGHSWDPSANAVVVLEEEDGELVEVGRVGGLGEGEQVKSVRWLDELAVVVTFRQTDPLYTVDLSEPDRPRLLGELKIPGFSAYLHPVGDDLLLGLGHDATTQGEDRGLQAATFDLRDLTDVRRADTLDLGAEQGLAVESDARAFTYLPSERTALTTVQDWSTRGGRVLALRIGPDGTVSEAAAWPVRTTAAGEVRTLALADGRVAIVDRGVRLVHLP